MNDIWIAFGLTLFAGLSTGIGSFIAFFAKRSSPRFLCASLGFSAGVMIYVSFVEIFRKAWDSIHLAYPSPIGAWITVGSFFGGIALMALIDRLIPSYENPHEVKSLESIDNVSTKLHDYGKLKRAGLFMALAIGIHNFPEGFATFLAALHDPSLGLAIALAIAIHNIPEGISVSVLIFYATGSRKKALIYSFLSGLAEPLGALIGYLLLRPFMTDTVFGIMFAMVAGVMVFISLDELLPGAEEYGEHHVAIYALIVGMVVMALSLLLLL